jgi:DNA repair exonuclease SbcCD ATPase subunit
MLHLAQIEKNESSGEAMLRVLACQRSQYAWAVLNSQERLLLGNGADYGDRSLVLVELSEANDVLEVKDAKDWAIDIIQSFMLSGITPAFLQEEAERAEQWRQMLTLQNQDLDRRALELEARREQLEQLEETLKREKKQLESLAAQCKDQTHELDHRATEMQLREEQLERLTGELEHRKQQLDEMLAEQGRK